MATIASSVGNVGLDSRADSLRGPEIDAPHGHFTIANPADLPPAEAQLAYNTLIDIMVRSYVASMEPTTRRYIAWPRYNSAPYPSATHGNRYVNNYVNPEAAAAGYGQGGVTMPPGAIIAKDSFTATQAGDLWPGALFVMEKLEPAVSPENGDWRYLMIMPDGSTFGDSLTHPARMAFCHECHAARAEDDYLFFVPTEAAAALPSAITP